ncbi:MAG TPA: phosphoglycolate phosphatase [Microvirga sp.]|jgi:phosphoglycolate phosphatase|nr:phosphoglycolate phosphatase [Microvirga sp.]
MMSLEAVLLDLDGTLVDSAEDLRDALNEILGRQGLRPVTPAEVRAMIGDGVLKLVERGLTRTGGDPARAADLVPAFLEAYEPRASRKTVLYPGVLDTLRRLRAAGLRLAVVTNKPEAATRQILDALGLAGLIEVVIGGDTLPRRKPDPAPVAAALRALGIAPEAAAMVGDNHHDVEAGHGAGLRTVLVGYGYAHGAPATLGADRVIDAFADLPQALRDLGFAWPGKG